MIIRELPASPRTAEGDRLMADTTPSERQLAGMSAATWRAAVGSPHLRSAMAAIFLLDRAPDPELLAHRMERVTQLFPALRSRIVESRQFGRPSLVEDPDFDLALHMAHYVMPAPGSWEQVLRDTRRYSLTDLDRDRALWRTVQLDGLRGGASVVILVVHHAIADGQGLVEIFGRLLGPDEPDVTDRSESRSMRRRVAEPERSRASRAAARMGRRASETLSYPSRVTGGIKHVAGSAQRTGRRHLSPRASLLDGRCTTYTARTLDLDMRSLRSFAKERSGTLNDAFLTGLTAGVRRYYEASGEPVGELRINVPVSFRTEGDRPDDNTQAIARISLDAAETDADARFAEARQATADAVRQPLLTHMHLVAEASRLLPVEAIVALSRGSDLTASNVPGVPVPVQLGGARVERIYPIVPTMGAAANVTLLSYAGRWCSIGVTMDEAAVDSPELLVECLAQGFAEIGVRLAAQPLDPLPLPDDGV